MALVFRKFPNFQISKLQTSKLPNLQPRRAVGKQAEKAWAILIRLHLVVGRNGISEKRKNNVSFPRDEW